MITRFIKGLKAKTPDLISRFLIWVAISNSLLLIVCLWALWLGKPSDSLENLGLLRGLELGSSLVISLLLLIIFYLLQKLEQTKQEREKVFNLSENLVCVANFEGYFQKVNPAWLSCLDYTEAELLSQSYLNFVHPDDQEATREQMLRLTQEQKVISFENRYRHRAGSYRTLAWTAIPLLDKSLVYAVARDVTEIRQAESNLRNHAALLTSIVNNLPIVIYSTDAEAKLTLVTGKGLEALGLNSEDLVGRSILELSEDVPESLRNFQAALEGAEKIWLSQFRGRYYQNHVIPSRNTHGEIIGILGIAYDLTQEQETQKLLLSHQELLSKIIGTISDGLLVLDREGKVLFLNPAALQFFGRSEVELLGHYLGLPCITQENTEICLLQATGQVLVAEMRADNMTWEHQNAYLVSLRDITERKQFEEELKSSEARLNSILGSLQDIVWSTEVDSYKVIYLNQMAAEIYGYPLSNFYEDPNFWFTRIHPEDQGRMQSYLDVLLERGRIELEFRIIRSDGQVRWLYGRSWLVYDEEGQAIRIDGIETDITERKETEAQLRQQTFYDPLTALPNRNLFLSSLSYACNCAVQNLNYRFAVLILDLDEFKVINDSLGHHLGDELLKAIAQRLQSSLSPTDLLARLGGDEFSILLEDLNDFEQVIHTIHNLQTVLAIPFNLNGYEIYAKTSIGVAINNHGHQTPEELLRNADTALYRAKNSGKNNYAIFDAQMHALAMARLKREVDLRVALEHNYFVLYYQPIISLFTGTLEGFEALIRLQHPIEGLISPVEFVSIAEETGLIVPIGFWVLREACYQLKKWHQQFPEYQHLSLSINLSGRQFKDPNLIANIDKILAETGLEGKFLKFEITESLLMEDVEEVLILLQEIRKRQIQICIDDFGTGYSSLSYLHRFPVNTLKIDRCFVKPLTSNPDSGKIVNIIIALAHSLGLDLIAEGVETMEQLNLLKQLNCEQVQGYFFSKPMPVAEVNEYLS